MTRNPSMQSVWPAVMGFLSLCVVAVVLGVAEMAGMIDHSMTRRGMGIVVGLMTLVTGNFLPKMRPFPASDDRIGTVAAAERGAGWIMVLIGLALVGLFTFSPLETARSLAPILALSGMGIIAADWIWVLSRRRRADRTAPTSPLRNAPRMLAIWLVFGVAYVLLMASLKMWSQAPWIREVGSWATVVFTTVYFLYATVLECRRRAGSPS